MNASNSLSNGPKMKERGVGNVKLATPKKKRAIGQINAKSEIEPGQLVLELPIRTVSEANCFEPWKKRYIRHKEQQRIVSLWLNPLRHEIKMPCKIMLTRFAPDSLDAFDNLPVSFKYIADAVCAIITGDHRPGRADGDKRITMACDQIKMNKYGIRIEITW